MQLAPCAASAAAARSMRHPRTTVDTRETRPLRTQKGASCSGPSSHNFRDLKRAVPSAPTSTSPLRRALLTKRVRPPHEVLYKLRRENPQIWLIRTETRENKIVSTTTCTYVVSVVKSTQQGNQEPTPARCRPTRDDLISSTPQNTQEPRTGRVAGVA